LSLWLNKPMTALILIRGGGDLASGVALRLHRAGLKALISELPNPLAVRRMVSFAEAVYTGAIKVEDVTGRLVKREHVQTSLDAGEIPVIVDPDASILTNSQFSIPVLIDGRMTKQTPVPLPGDVALHIGLGPGFLAGKNCHAVVETRRSHTLGRVYWNGSSQPDSGRPEGDPRRVLRAPADGILESRVEIGAHVEAGQIVAEVAGNPILAPFPGVVRGLIHPGLKVSTGLKVGDIDVRDEREACFLVSDKALAIGGGVLEAILSREDLRTILWK